MQIQQIVSEEEFPSFIEAIQTELPSTFRITGTRRYGIKFSTLGSLHCQSSFHNAISVLWAEAVKLIENFAHILKQPYMVNWHPFYEARFGIEIFIEVYDPTLSSLVSSYVLERYSLPPTSYLSL